MNEAAKIDEEKWLKLKFSASEEQIKTLFRTYREFGIEPILIKGWAAGRLYPQPWQRYSSDIDLAVAPDKYEQAQKLSHLNPQINTDVHKGLRHLDTVFWKDLYQNSRLITLNNTGIRILREEDHLRVLCVHWLQDGGAYQNRLWDIFYAVENRSRDFDWSRCLEIVSIKRKFWIIYTIGLAHLCLGLILDDFPYRAEALRVPKWMKIAVEREWSEQKRLAPLDNSLYDSKAFWTQIKKRFPPNPIQATIDVNGRLNNFPRVFHQFGSIGLRTIPSIRRLFGSFFNRKRFSQ